MGRLFSKGEQVLGFQGLGSRAWFRELWDGVLDVKIVLKGEQALGFQGLSITRA